MRHAKSTLTLFLTLAFVLALSALAGAGYKVKYEHQGGDLTPAQAYEMAKKDNVFLIDCRTRAEYQFVGHPEGAYNVPLQCFSPKAGKKGYENVANPDFGKELRARFNPETDTLIFFCRSGGRSCRACDAAVEAGFSKDKVFNLMGGFEGDKVKDKNSPFCGQRKVNGWRNEGMPWTYHMDRNLMYGPDVK